LSASHRPTHNAAAYIARTKGYPAFPTSVGEHIRKRRLDLKLFQIDAAKITGCDEMTVVDWEKGHSIPALCHMAGIVQFSGFDPLPEGVDLAGKLLHHRQSRGMSQKQFAAQIGLDPGTLARWERRERFPDAKQLGKLGRAGLRMGNGRGIR
jgi:transcriptional regulator with XRE-family HTH domain